MQNIDEKNTSDIKIEVNLDLFNKSQILKSKVDSSVEVKENFITNERCSTKGVQENEFEMTPKKQDLVNHYSNMSHQ